jgi:hypothetical protein
VLLVYNAVNRLPGFFDAIMDVISNRGLTDKDNRNQGSDQMEQIGGRAVDLFINFRLAGIKIHLIFLHGARFFGKGDVVFGKITIDLQV